MFRYVLGYLFLIVVMSSAVVDALDDPGVWSELPSLPDHEGFAGPFAGAHRSALLVGGGANFPDKMPWEGGRKVWYDRVYVLESLEGPWKVAGQLPRPLGYGVSISIENGLLCLGGSDATQHYSDCFQLSWEEGKLKTKSLPSLPKPCANFCGAMIGSTVYVAGGLESPTSTNTLNTFWSLQLSNPDAKWEILESWPGPSRMLATAAVVDEKFYLVSGSDLKPDITGKPMREYLRDAYAYQPGNGWKKIADLPRAAVAAPTPAPITERSFFLIIGGDDGSLVDFQPLAQHPGFPKSILSYDPGTDRWQVLGNVPVSHVTTSSVRWNGRTVIPSGEIRPGKRSPKVWAWLK